MGDRRTNPNITPNTAGLILLARAELAQATATTCPCGVRRGLCKADHEEEST